MNNKLLKNNLQMSNDLKKKYMKYNNLKNNFKLKFVCNDRIEKTNLNFSIISPFDE